MTHGRPTGSGGGRTLAVEGLARVEGEGALRVEVRDGAVADVELRIFEPPRYFEELLRGRPASDAPDLTARVCGICPVSYQLAASAAVEDAVGVDVATRAPRIAALRRLLACGEWVQSHALHVTVLHAPDFYGLPDAVALAEIDPAAVRRGLALKRMGSRLIEAVGGRAVHPVNVRVGGFYQAPDPDQVAALAEPLRRAVADAVETVEWVSGFDVPDVEGAYRFVALRPDEGYVAATGRVVASGGRLLDGPAFAELAVETEVPTSTARQARLAGRDAYLTGPLARYALVGDRLPAEAAAAARSAGLGAACTNPFRSIVVRAVELVAACEEAAALVDAYEPPDPPAVDLAAPVEGAVGVGLTEAPRGVLLHRYVLGADATVRAARLMPPTAQNHPAIEDDLRRVASAGLDLPDDALTARCEQAVRNHDPCISCAAHFLDVTVERS